MPRGYARPYSAYRATPRGMDNGGGAGAINKVIVPDAFAQPLQRIGRTYGNLETVPVA